MYSNQLAHRDDARDEADYQADIKSASEIMKVKNELKLLRDEIRKINKVK